MTSTLGSESLETSSFLTLLLIFSSFLTSSVRDGTFSSTDSFSTGVTSLIVTFSEGVTVFSTSGSFSIILSFSETSFLDKSSLEELEESLVSTDSDLELLEVTFIDSSLTVSSFLFFSFSSFLLLSFSVFSLFSIGSCFCFLFFLLLF